MREERNQAGEPCGVEDEFGLAHVELRYRLPWRRRVREAGTLQRALGPQDRSNGSSSHGFALAWPEGL